MRTRVFSWVLAIGMATLCTLPAVATTETSAIAVKKKKLKKLKHPVAQKLAGLFQMCITYNGELRPMPVLKHYNIYGEYTTYVSINGTMGISGHGNYTVADGTDDKNNQYTEHIGYLMYAPDLKSQDAVMQMRWIDDDTFVVTFQLSGGTPTSETWTRVKQVNMDALRAE